MAIMFPDLSEDKLNSLRSRAESHVYRRCRDRLGAEFNVVHSLALIKTQGRLAPEDGEAEGTSSSLIQPERDIGRRS